MGRNIKQGLSYFPVDVDIFEDEKIQFVSAIYGPLGEGVTIRLLCRIYRNGYFIFFDDDVALLFSRSAGDISLLKTIKEVVDELLKRGFFDKGMFDNYKILTSAGIQRRYNKICADAKRINYQIDEKFDLLRRKQVFTPEEIAKTHGESTQRKEEEIKEEETKGGGGAEHPARASKDDFKIAIDSFEKVQEVVTNYEWLSDASASLNFDIIDFEQFVSDWVNAKRVTGDWHYPEMKIKEFIIADFKKQKQELSRKPRRGKSIYFDGADDESKLCHNDVELHKALEILHKDDENENQ